MKEPGPTIFQTNSVHQHNVDGTAAVYAGVAVLAVEHPGCGILHKVKSEAASILGGTPTTNCSNPDLLL